MTSLPTLSPEAPLDDIHTALMAEGVVVIPELIPSADCDAIKDALAPFLKMEKPGRNPFEGHLTERVYALLNKTDLLVPLVLNPIVLDMVDRVLSPGALLSACLAINIHKGETPQGLHSDDSFYYVPRPREALGVSAFWAIDEFTEQNGATEVIPGSHKWGAETPYDGDAPNPFAEAEDLPLRDGVEIVKAVMPKGSLMLALGTTIHRGGGNTADAPRLGITPQYCASWLRTLENMPLAIAPEKVAAFPERLQELLGYSIHPPFIGYVDGVHPKKTLPSP